MRLPSYGPGLNPKHILLFQLVIDLGCEKDENKQKEAERGPYFNDIQWYFPFESEWVFYTRAMEHYSTYKKMSNTISHVLEI